MGQYYYIVNLDKKQYLHPHKFDDGLKLMEFGQSAGGTLLGLTILLADGNGRGGGDLMCNKVRKARDAYIKGKRKAQPNYEDNGDLVGSWAGDRIVIAGDYADPGKFIESTAEKNLQAAAKKAYAEGYQQKERVNLHSYAQEVFEDISCKVIAILKDANEWERGDKEFGGDLRPDIVITTK